MAKANMQKVVVVTGDVTMDWNLARTRRLQGGPLAWNSEDCTHACWQRGGAALLADMIEAVANSLSRGQSAWLVHQMAAPREPVHPGDSRFHHSYAMWSLFKYGGKPPYDKEKSAWRVEEFLGLDRCPGNEASDAEEWKQVVDDTPEADLVVLDDSDLGFRDHPALWPRAITDRRRRPWILLKIARPVAQGALWEHLHQNRNRRLVVVMWLNDLRRTEVQISRELSWERAAQDVFWELVHNPRVNALSHCAHVIVSFGPAGAVLLSREHRAAEERGIPRCFLFFDPTAIEGMWEHDHPGGMIGYTTCLTASISRQFMLSPNQPNIHQGIQSGLAAMRTLHLEGYGERGAAAAQVRLAFPTKLITAELAKDAAPFAVTEVQDPLRLLTGSADKWDKPSETSFWTILKDRYPDNLDQVAQRVVLEGPEVVLKDVPVGQFGDLLTVDRRETENFRSIRALVGEYCRQIQQKRPLSLAVFGTPGAGKSFGITQVASSLLPEQIEVLEFNLSQLGSPDDLVDALHQVRDTSLSGKIPLVFWDEFDTPLTGKPLGWLCYFLVPMQDGKFQEGQITHPIGRAIFVFAGSTCERMETFGQGLAPAEFRAAKGPDFVSRLRGYVNVLGPDPQEGTTGVQSTAAPYYIIRRAILLRSILKRNAPQVFEKRDGEKILDIDPGVLRAFLKTREYKHGVRSMEAIVAMSLLAEKIAFERSSLPAEAQLDLHVDGRDFLALVQQMDLEGDLLEKLAKAAHEVFCDGLKARGYRLGLQTDDELKTHSLLKPYADLTEEKKEQNRGNIRDIANKLASVGYVMVPARSNEPPFDFPGDDLEQLAEMEHNRWMKAKINVGWRYASERDDAKKLTPALLPWRKVTEEERARLFSPAEIAAMGDEELAEEQKDKDRDLVRAIPKVLTRAGYAIVKLHGQTTRQ